MPLARIQERTQRRTQLLKLKAEAERERLEKAPPADAQEKAKERSLRKGLDPER